MAARVGKGRTDAGVQEPSLRQVQVFHTPDEEAPAQGPQAHGGRTRADGGGEGGGRQRDRVKAQAVGSRRALSTLVITPRHRQQLTVSSCRDEDGDRGR